MGLEMDAWMDGLMDAWMMLRFDPFREQGLKAQDDFDFSCVFFTIRQKSFARTLRLETLVHALISHRMNPLSVSGMPTGC